MKSQFDELCNKFGMSVNTAFNIFVNAVVRSPYHLPSRMTELNSPVRSTFL